MPRGTNAEGGEEVTWPSYEIELGWYSDAQTAPEIGEKVLQTFDRLRDVSDVMDNWQIIAGAGYKYVPLAEAAPRIAEIVQDSVNWKYDNGPDDPAYGFNVFAIGMRTLAEVHKPDTVVLSVTAGSAFDNSVTLEIGGNRQPTDLKAVTYETYLGALSLLASLWPCAWAVGRVYGPAAVETPIDVPGFKGYFTGPFGAPWMAYLSAPLAAGLRAPPEMRSAPTPGGGVVLSAVEGMIDLENPEHVRLAGALRAILETHIGVQPNLPSSPARHEPRKGPY
jgi:hypothetical protein